MPSGPSSQENRRAPEGLNSAARRALLAGSAAVLLAANALLAVEFRLDLAVTGRRPTWHDLGTRRVTFLIEELQRLKR